MAHEINNAAVVEFKKLFGRKPDINTLVGSKGGRLNKYFTMKGGDKISLTTDKKVVKKIKPYLLCNNMVEVTETITIASTVYFEGECVAFQEYSYEDNSYTIYYLNSDKGEFYTPFTKKPCETLAELESLLLESKELYSEGTPEWGYLPLDEKEATIKGLTVANNTYKGLYGVHLMDGKYEIGTFKDEPCYLVVENNTARVEVYYPEKKDSVSNYLKVTKEFVVPKEILDSEEYRQELEKQQVIYEEYLRQLRAHIKKNKEEDDTSLFSEYDDGTSYGGHLD